MRILYLANAGVPTIRAYGLQIAKTCEALADEGAAVTLITPSRARYSWAKEINLPKEPFSFYSLRENFRFIRVPAPDLLSWGPLGFLIGTLWFSEAGRLTNAFAEADLIYSRDALVLFQYLLLGRRLVYEAHAKPSLVSRFVARRAYRVVVISKGLSGAYAQIGVEEKRILVAPDAVDLQLFSGVPERAGARAALDIPEGERLVLYVGHLFARKGADTLAASASQIDGATVAFVGGTPEDIRAFKERWGSVKNIRVIGRVPHERVPLYLRAADVLVIPNSGKDEDAARFTSPMKLFEYMASGTPIVASDVPALREVLTDASARFFAPDDPEALAGAIQETLADPAEAARRSAAALTAAHAHSWNARARAILAFTGN